MASSSLMASQTLILKNPNFLSPHNPRTHCLPNLSKPRTLSLSVSSLITKPLTAIASSSSLSATTSPNPTTQHSLLIGSTRTITTIFTIALSVSKLLASKASTFALASSKSPILHSIGPLFFAALKDRPSGYLNTPLTVVASGMSKWLDIYSGVLMVRVLLSWFPNIPWDRQPLSAIRDLCDPYLNLFRNIIPPIFDTLDVSPLLAFAVLGTLGSILNNSRGAY